MKTINIKNELNEWLVKYITNTIHNLYAEDSDEFNKWAENFKESEAKFVVDMEFCNDWGYDEREDIDENEAEKYASTLIQTILDNWFL